MKAITLGKLRFFRVIFLCLNLFYVEAVLSPLAAEENSTSDAGKFHEVHLENLERQREVDSVPQGDVSDGKETGGLLKSSIVLFAVTFAGITIAKSCLKKASSVTFLAAAITYITAEIAFFTEFYQDGKKGLRNYQENKYDKRQVGALDEASKRAKKAADIALAKSIIQATAAAGFLVASVLAITEAAIDFPKFTGDCFSTGIFPETPARRLVQSWLNFLIPDAKAGVKIGTIGPMLAGIGVGAAAAAAITSSMSGALGSSFAGAMGSGYTRGAVFGVFAGFATWSATEAGIASNKLRKNEREYKRLSQEAGRLKKKRQLVVVEEQETTAKQRQSVRNSSQGLGNKEQSSYDVCLEGQSIGEDAKTDKDCSCRTTNTCTKVQLPSLVQDAPNLPGGDTLANAASAFSNSANAVFSGDLQKAQLEGQNAQRLATRLKTYKSDYVDLANKKIAASGGKPMDNWDELEKKTEKFLTDKVSSALGSLSREDRSALAELAPELKSDKSIQEDIAKNSSDLKQINSQAANADLLGLNIGGDKNPIKTGFEFLDESGDKKRLRAVAGKSHSKKAKGKFSSSGLRKEDGIAGRNKDLFKIVTKRYHSSAYSSFFDEGETIP